ncbi:MAG TPA: heat-inducible transcriptional repressor HrcA [Chloroflexia bacterium]|nr:heat-inducible transcriptional repressor HrcA [Chloroflexia bacterium]
MGDELSERQRAILRLLIEQYVATARPVASDVLAANPHLTVSPATIRNAMADLERAGYILQPHTSAGRVPSDKGYRYFVEHLMGTAILPQSEQRTIDHQFHQVELDVEEWMHLAASLLSRLVHNAAVVTTPHSTIPRLKHFQLLDLAERRAMLLLVVQDGTLTQQLLTLEEDWDQEHLSALATEANKHFHHLSAGELAEAVLPPDAPPLLSRVRAVLAGLLARLEEPAASRLHREGLSQLIDQPEFRETDRLKQMLDLLEGDSILLSIVPAVQAREGVQIIIGDEHRSDQMRNCSVVVARYGLPNDVNGVIGVIGPTRMPYGRAVSSVRYLSDLLTGLLDQIYGANSRADA